MTAARLAESFLISVAEFDACWEILRLGEPPAQLAIPSPGRTRAARRELLVARMAELAQRDLAAQGEPTPALAADLETLAHPQEAVDAHLLLPQPINAVGAIRHGRGALAARSGDRVWIGTMTPQQLIPELVALAGDVPPGPGESASVRAEVLPDAARRADGDPHVMAEELIARGERPTPAAMLAQMAHRPIRQGQFGASVRTASGVRRRAARLVTFHDTQAGRYLQVRRGMGRDEWVTMTPADNGKIVHALRELVEEAG
ncbi:ESX secretion-associated protein EspG [Actinoalloteichus hymeniacidonis]|uniref:EspG family n=1 Tax=Actinoalloteichus hymeniacidonis TaxID=340345 RepID=A0AAC9HM57_9PSEU|nr:ESX secretion-associated protein EspG [Actinoalloteichus hymeniacidonis]AOS61748.1 EspG family [Actinoalloteichus hymeniacidonis]MBB5910234.1 hypothetical protein [Actinoalloteichus hymeniacidonis]